MKTIMKLSLILIVLSLHSIEIEAQRNDRPISGTVTNYSWEPIVGVLIQVIGTDIKTTTDSRGKYEFYIPSGDIILEYSYPGYDKVERELGASNIIDVIMEEEYDPCLWYNDRILLVEFYPYDVFLASEKKRYNYHLNTNIDQKLYYKEANLNQGVDILNGINESPGVDIFKVGLNNSSIRMRGISTQKATIDDIPIYLGGRFNLLEDLEAHLFKIARIEKGANFESNMQHGGHINFTSKYHRPFFSSLFSGGEDGFFKTSNTLNYVYEHDDCYSKHFTVNHTLTTSDGLRNNSSYKKHSFTINGLPMGPNEDRHYRFFMHFADVERGLAGPLSLNELENNPRLANPEWASIEAFDHHKTGLIGFSKDFNIKEKEDKYSIKNTSSLFGIWNQTDRLTPSFLLNNSMWVWGGKTKFEYRNIDRRPYDSFFYAGLEYYDEWLSWSIFSPDDLQETELLNRNQERRTYFDLFLGTKQYFGEHFNLTAGLNVNKSFIKTHDQFESDTINYNQREPFNLVFSPQIEARYKFYHKRWMHKFVGKVSHGLARVPTGTISTPENPRRYLYDPERSWNYEIGIIGEMGSRSSKDYMLSFYLMDRRNILNNDSLSLSNDNNARHSGVELYLKNGVDHFEWFASYNYAFSRFDNFLENGQNYSNQQVAGFSPHRLNIGLLLKNNYDENTYRWFYARLDYEYGSAAPLNNENNTFAPAYHLLHAKVGFRMEPLGFFIDKNDNLGIEIFAGVNNILNRKYASAFISTNELQENNGLALFYPGNTRFIYAGVKFEIIEKPKELKF